ncbi:MAG: hypothetical protein POELPBGB_01412 [Bacteroidia bacterium]|nr:hypothetical protein [Bacteroidia bacterium]
MIRNRLKEKQNTEYATLANFFRGYLPFGNKSVHFVGKLCAVKTRNRFI